MAKGAAAKQEIFNKILNMFPGSFMFNNGKELRINMFEDGEPVQIKITLTAAKDIISNNNMTTSEDQVPSISTTAKAENPPFDTDTTPKYSEPTEEEKENLSRLVAQMF